MLKNPTGLHSNLLKILKLNQVEHKYHFIPTYQKRKDKEIPIKQGILMSDSQI